VEDEIPTQAGLYLAMSRGKHSIAEVYEGIDGLQFNPNYDNTHWMPLPAPPLEQGEKKV